MSAARHLGLWVLPDTRLHVALPPSASRAIHRADVALHWSHGIIPPAGRFAVDSIENSLYFVTRCRPHDEAVAAVDSALNKKLVRRGNLDALATRVGGTFARVVADADGRADSGLESLPRVRLARRGITMHPQAIVDGHAIDGLIGDRLLLQFDGDRFHSTPKARQRDREEDRWLALQGYTVLRFGTSDVLRDWPRAEAQIREAIAADLHLWPAARVRSLESPTRVIRARPSVV
ncbi:endonuclease domain-containing protein [Agromyces atrinae]|uniref:endonuclease domain-containing protein n=1 Tax=Agromyces atrinae TaxID=592376 RepID=UPI001F56572B|nr:DUF559 domain-containing protein [Agromyces atrinae]MCI2959669.1 endonuclease domain-containing protein [Agromyces atrinae]